MSIHTLQTLFVQFWWTPNWLVKSGVNAGLGARNADTSAKTCPLKSCAWYLHQVRCQSSEWINTWYCAAMVLQQYRCYQPFFVNLNREMQMLPFRLLPAFHHFQQRHRPTEIPTKLQHLLVASLVILTILSSLHFLRASPERDVRIVGGWTGSILRFDR